MIRNRGKLGAYLLSLIAGIAVAATDGRTAGEASPAAVNGGPAAPTTQPDALTVTGITTPRQIVKLASTQLERISRIAVVEGQIVSEGDAVIAFDDAVQRARTETARAAAESALEVELARHRMEQA